MMVVHCPGVFTQTVLLWATVAVSSAEVALQAQTMKLSVLVTVLITSWASTHGALTGAMEEASRQHGAQ